jgi:hypothetical protein
VARCLSRCKLHVLSPLQMIVQASSTLTHLDLSWNLMSARSSSEIDVHDDSCGGSAIICDGSKHFVNLKNILLILKIFC